MMEAELSVCGKPGLYLKKTKKISAAGCCADVSSAPPSVTALLFKMEEANLASRAKAQEFIQATSQVSWEAHLPLLPFLPSEAERKLTNMSPCRSSHRPIRARHSSLLLPPLHKSLPLLV